MNNLKEITPAIAKTYLKQGFSIIPAYKDKRPALKGWKQNQNTPMAETEADRFFPAEAIAIITGFGNLEVIDVDTKHDQTGDLWPDLWVLIWDNLPDTARRLVIASTQNGGKHIYYKCPKPDKNLKLASNLAGATLIETRGSGGYVIAPPSPGYTFEQGTPEEIPTITQQEREILLSICKSLDEAPDTPTEPQKQGKKAGSVNHGTLSPFEDYGRRGDVLALLERHGWEKLEQQGDKIYFKRPGDTDNPKSANFHTGENKFWVWSTSQNQFDHETAYSPTSVFALLECNGDLSEASRRLYELGYGDRRKTQTANIDNSLLPPDEAVSYEEQAPEGLPEPITNTKATPAQIAQKLAGSGLFAATTREGLKIYKNGIWVRVENPSDVTKYIAVSFGRKATPAKIRDGLMLIPQYTLIEDGRQWNHEAKNGWLPFQNHEVNYNTFETRPLLKESYWTYKINAEYNPILKPIKWLEFLESTFKEDPDKDGKIKAIKQYFGLCMTPDMSHQKAMLLIGPGANGKGIISHVIFNILKDASAHIDLKDLSNPNRAVNLIAKTLAGDADLSKGSFDDGTFKKAVVGETIPAKLLYENSFDIAPIAKFLFSANSLPITKDVSPGYFRRWILITFPNTFDPSQGRDIKDDLLKDKDAIVNWMIEGLREIKKEGQLFIPASHHHAINEYKNEASSVFAFINDRTTKRETGKVLATTVHKSYLDFCEEEGFKHPLGRNTFYSELAKNTVASKRKESGQFYIYGIELTHGNNPF